MKYIDADKLIAFKEALADIIVSSQGLCTYGACKERAEQETPVLLGIITSLQQEQPNNEDIDKVAQELYEHLYELKRRNNVQTNLYDKQEIINLWKAGIEYAYNHPKQEQPEVELKKEVKSYIKHNFTITDEVAQIPEEDRRYSMWEDDMRAFAKHFFELGRLNARKK